ncbi:MAG: cupredoxin domain-containing protein [Rhodanobacteraceae bacterium]
MRFSMALAFSCATLLACTAHSHAGESAAIEVSMQQFGFVPAAITVPAGATVTWTNRDTVPHTVTSADGAFDSGPIEPGKSFQRTVQKPAAYHCIYHPSMTGSIELSPAR